MAEISQRHVVLIEEHRRHSFAANDFFLPIFQSDAAQRSMTESVIAEFETILRPHSESFDPVIHFAKLVELLFVDESDSRNFLVAQCSQKLRGHFYNLRT